MTCLFSFIPRLFLYFSFTLRAWCFVYMHRALRTSLAFWEAAYLLLGPGSVASRACSCHQFVPGHAYLVVFIPH